MWLLEHTKSHYFRSPEFSVANFTGNESRLAGGQRITLRARTWEKETAWEFASEKWAEVDFDARGEIASTLRFGAETQAESISCDRLAVSGVWRVETQHEEGIARVLVSGPFVGTMVLWTGFGIAAAPALAETEEGAWIAFHHNVRETNGEPDIAKWIALRFVDRGGAAYELAEPLKGLNRDQEGEEQGFEFPSLVAHRSGAVTLLGRGSHRFWYQHIDRRGSNDRIALGEGGWGCRGRRVAAVRVESEASAEMVLTARREKKGIVCERIAIAHGPHSGPPELRRVETHVASSLPARASAVHVRSKSFRDPAAQDGLRTLFGDLHQHSAHSDGCGAADEAYLRARYHYGDDFTALTDHESFLGKRIGPHEWQYLESIADAHDDPGRFATLIAYEWTGVMHPGPGHKVVYWPRTGMPVFSRDDVPDGTELVRRVSRIGGFCAPHHIGWTGSNAEAHDPKGQPAWEMCSCHGCYETPGHPLGFRGELYDHNVFELLRRGLRFGLMASSDSHGLLFHHGVARKRDPFRTGLTAVQAKHCTREAIFAALASRRCYATSGAKILLDLRAGDHPMGTVIKSHRPVELSAQVLGTSEITRLSFIGPEGAIRELAPRASSARAAVEVGPGSYAYLRVEQNDGEMAWSSPIWVDPPA